MTLQPRPHNPIEQRKQAVRRYARTGVIGVGASLVGGGVLALAGGLSWLLIGLVFALVIGGVNAYRINKIINHVDEY
ncbi:hypothetical protein ACFPVT_02670 [Corynebacterium choanae]|uniref:Secreted protein n=1 Tax=Corynebacterium choanae TaxID=1862358 RepID=A0A3G6J538_9CORY|nr:hypothetical protein [Corynebacterium choanae]AZA12982.1 hypothetical protein CCHOA_02830 [Corynebacterium choanae]